MSARQSIRATAYPGEHQALVDTVIFQRVQEILAGNSRQRAATTRRATPALLKGLIFTDSGRAMTPSHTRKGSRLYRYYVSTDVIRGREKTSAGLERIPAELVEKATITEMLRLIQTPQVTAEAV